MAPTPAAAKTPNAPKTPTKTGRNPSSSATSKLGQSQSAADSPSNTAKSASQTPKGGAKGAADKAKSSAPTNTRSPKLPPRPQGGAGKAADKAKDAAPEAPKQAEEAKGKAEDTAEDAKGKAEDTKEKAEDTAEDAGTKIGMNDNEDDTETEETPLGKVSQAGNETGAEESSAVSTQDDTEDTAEGAQDTAEGAKDKATGGLGDVSKKAQDTADDATEGTADDAQQKAGGEILGPDGEPVGQLDEGDPEDLIGKTIGDNGEILDEDGDVIGRASVLPEYAEKMAKEAEAAALPDIGVLEGMQLNKEGDVVGEDGTPLGKLVEGDAEDLAGKDINDKGEILDEDGDVIGRVEVVPGEAAEEMDEVDKAVEAGGLTPDLSILAGKKINKKGKILDEEGETLGQLTEDSDLKQCVGKIPNEKGEIINDQGDVVGRVEVVPGEAADEAMRALNPELVQKIEEAQQKAEEEAGDVPVAELPDLDILDGLKVNKKGEVLNEDGEPIARLILDKEGNVIGKVELIPEAFQPEETPEEEGEGEAEEGAEDGAGEQPSEVDVSVLDGLKVNKKGEVVNEDGDAIARLVEGEIEACAGKKLNEKGEVLDSEGNVIGKVEMIPSEPEEEEGEPEPEVPPLSILEGLKVNKKGEVVNEDGDPIARLVEGELEACAGKKLNENGEVLDSEGNVIGKVEMIPSEPEEEQEEGEPEPELPPLSILEGLKCNKQGKVVDADGKPLGELTDGDPKRLVKLGAECDAEGQFWDGKGNVIAHAVTLPQADDDEEAPFAGLYGLIVVEDGFVEDENENKVGVLVEGDAAKLVGRAVDEDGDVLDKRGNVIGHAERYEEPPEEEVTPDDLSVLNGLAVTKAGLVIDANGVPIGRLVEGDAKELAGKKCDAEGQIWNDSGKVIGRCELIPENERPNRQEGPFAGLEGLVVVKGGKVEDEDGNVVGEVVEGDPKRLVGRAVDEDGDIVDKYGNVKGHAEPYEEEEEEAADLSSLEGKVVNKAGNVVDEHGTIFGRIVSGDPVAMAGRKCDGQGQIWGDTGNVIGQAELIPGGEQIKPEGPFSGFEGLVVAKDGMVTDQNGQIVGRVIEGDAEKLLGRKVDDDGDILDKAGNSIGKAERFTPEEKERQVNPMAGHHVNREGEVRDENGELIGRLTEGNLGTCIGKEIDDNGYVIDNDGNRIGECTLIENIEEPEEEEEGPTEEELEAMRKKEQDAEIAKKMTYILKETLDKMEPICKNITDRIDKADKTPKEELDEEQLVQDVKPMLEEGNRVLQECNGAIRGLDPDGSIAANAKARAASGEATKEEHALAESLKELTSTVVKTIDNAKKRIADMPHAKKGLSPLWGLLTEPLFQIIAAVGLLLTGVLGLVGKLLNGLGLGGIVNGLLGGLGIDKLLGGLGLGSVGEALGLGGGKKKK
ncbi:hypothetical protein G7Y79_00017g042280 [Physcia stellaris]|nr:hypothetical protein G7Y79_00017g042280 [Physcia stellaris]